MQAWAHACKKAVKLTHSLEFGNSHKNFDGEGFISEQLCWVETVAHTTQDWSASKNQLEFVSVCVCMRGSVQFGKVDNLFAGNFSLTLAETSKRG